MLYEEAAEEGTGRQPSGTYPTLPVGLDSTLTQGTLTNSGLLTPRVYKPLVKEQTKWAEALVALLCMLPLVALPEAANGQVSSRIAEQG